MFPGVDNLTLVRGAQFSVIGYQMMGGSGPFNLTGFTLAGEVRVQPGDTVILDLQPVISDAASGMFEVPAISAEDTAILPIGVYQYGIMLIDVYNEPFGPFLIGQFYIVDKIPDS